jgi:Na+-transporting NADH:ubiquinone oxidoreductase subunit C
VHSNKYTVFYAVMMTVAVAVVLSLAASGLRTMQDANVARARRASILETVIDVNPETLEQDYNAYITERVFDYQGNAVDGVDAFDLDVAREARKAPEERLFPAYQFERQGQIRFIVPVQGAGLWGPISAYLALDSDFSTITGVRFDHEKETPGLGAEISTPSFESRFEGKQLYEGGEFVSIRVVKAGADASGAHAVDGLTGATMTMNGVSAMLEDELMLYQSIFEELDP